MGSAFAIFPLLSSISWITTLVILFVLWIHDGKPKYKVTSPDITYISNVGSAYKTVFITGASLTAAFFVATLFVFLFHNRSTFNRNFTNSGAGVQRKPRTWSDFLSFIFGIVASAALVLLTVYDSINHETVHWIFTLTFALCAIICAIFNVISLSTNRGFQRRKFSSFVLKILFIIASTLVLGAFLGLMYSCNSNGVALTSSCNDLHSIAAVLEWTLALLFFVFTLSWIIDFL